MIDVMIDMTQAKAGTVANDEGSMCAIGATAWTLGCPLDVMVGWADDGKLTPEEMNNITYDKPTELAFEGILRALKLDPGQYKSGWLWEPHDEMHKKLGQYRQALMMGKGRAGSYKWEAYGMAMLLMVRGEELGINFIIASSLPRGLWKIRKKQKTAAKQVCHV